MNRLKRVAKTLGKVLLWVLGFVFVVLLLLLAEPKWVLNKKNLVWALGKVSSYEIKWSSLAFEVRNENLLTKRVVFKTTDFCARAKDESLNACFPLLDLDATIHIGLSPVVSVRRLERAVVHSRDVVMDETKSPQQKPPEKKKSSSGSVQLVPRPLRHMTVGLIDVRIPRAFVRTSSGTTTAKVDAAFTERGDAPLTADAYVVTTGTSSTPTGHYKADLSLATDLWRMGKVSYLDLKARLRGDQGLSANVNANVRPPKKGVLRLTASADATAAGKILKARVTGGYSQDGTRARADLAVEDPKGAVRRFGLEDCRFEEPMHKGKPEKADLRCGIAIVPAPFGEPKNAPLKKLTGELTAHASFKRLRMQKDHFTAQVKVEIAPQALWSDFHAHFEAALAGRTGDIPRSLTAEHKLDVGLTIKRFQQVVQYLQDTEFAIPAPVNAFEGPVTLELKTAGDSRGENQRIVYRAATGLTSPKQALKTEVTGHVDVRGLFLQKKTIVDKTEVDLKDVAIQLPDISLKGAAKMPSPSVDTRIKTGEPKRDQAAEAKRPGAPKSTETAVDFDAHVFTSKPVRILTNLIKAPVPIGLDLHAIPAGLSGSIQIQPFDLEVFHQTGHVDHITLKPSPGSSDMALDGKIVYKRQDVTVNILLVGSTSKPTITFESDPPMTQQEIMAMLLYGKSPNELDSDQQASAGNAASAFTNGALGLTSLYLFASTPIDSVGYDAATQTYQIKFKLPGGATLGVGSNLEESKTLTLRKRVARNLELETEMRQSQQQSQRRDAVTTFLQWFRRY